MSAAPARADFKLILNAVTQARLPAIIAELMEVLNIDRRTATEAVQNAPIILVAGMTQQQAANIRTHLLRLTKLGAQLRLTSEAVGKLKQFRWQALPPSVRRPANVFVCPTCGERFIVQRWGAAPVAAAPPAAAAPAPVPAPGAPAPAPAAPAAPPAEPAGAPEAEAVPEAEPVPEAEALAAEEIPEAEPVPDDVPEAEPVDEPAAPAPATADEVSELTDFLDSVIGDEESPAPPPQPAPAPAAPAAQPASPDGLVMLDEEAEAAPSAPPALPTQPAAPARPPQAPAPPQPAPQPAPKPAPAKPAPARPAPARPAPAKAAAAKPKPAASAGPRYDVSVAKVRPPKLDKLVEALVERQGISFEEAQKLCERTVVVVCRGGNSPEADEWRKALLAIGIKPRIRKR